MGFKRELWPMFSERKTHTQPIKTQSWISSRELGLRRSRSEQNTLFLSVLIKDCWSTDYITYWSAGSTDYLLILQLSATPAHSGNKALSPLFLTNIFILKCLLVEHKTPPTILWGPFSVQGGLKWRNISHRGHRFNIWGDSSNHHLVTTSKMRLKASVGDCLIYHIRGRLHSNSSKQRGRM